MSRVGGIITVKANSQTFSAKGAFTYSIGTPIRTAVVGHDGVHGFSELPQVAYIAGEFTDNKDLDIKDLASMSDVVVTLDLANGKSIVLTKAFFVENLEGNTEEGSLSVRFESGTAFEV